MSAGAFTPQWILPAVDSHFFHKHGIVWLVVVDEDADGAGHQGEDHRGYDASVRYGSLQIFDPVAIDVEQQRHHTQSGHAGAGCHDNAGVSRGKRRSINIRAKVTGFS